MRSEAAARIEAPTSEAQDALDEEALGLFDRVFPLIPELRNYLRRWLAANEVEDVVQDVFLRLAQRDTTSPVETPKRYLYQVARAAVIDRHRRNVSRCVAEHRELTEGDHPSDDLSPLRILEAREDVRAARAVIAAMPERRREILIALRLEGASAKTVATRYGISTSAVEKHLTRALRSLADCARA
ncbi:MAG TPA: sigma-70 family RNA polymerase sigma factor [Phenylobacterium sp.]